MKSEKQFSALLQVLAGEQQVIQRTDQKAFTLLSVLGVFMVFFIVHFPKLSSNMNLSIFILIKKLITFELGLGALDKNTIFFEFFFSFSTASIALGLSTTPLCITPHKSIIKVSYFSNMAAKWFSSFNLLFLSF